MLTGSALLHEVAQRIITSHLRFAGAVDVNPIDARLGGPSGSVDITCVLGGTRRNVKVKADAYFGTDAAKCADRELPFYRPDGHAYAFEAISDAVTREPGWMFSSPADYLYYYRLILAQPEAEVAALVAEPDVVLFAELRVDRDELRVLPMAATREWFEGTFEHYTPRPVHVGTHTAWYRLVPMSDLDSAVPGIEVVGGIFERLARAAS